MRKLDEEKVKLIFKLRREGMHLQAIADQLGVTKGMISHALKGIRWKHVEGALTPAEVKKLNLKSQRERIQRQTEK